MLTAVTTDINQQLKTRTYDTTTLYENVLALGRDAEGNEGGQTGIQREDRLRNTGDD